MDEIYQDGYEYYMDGGSWADNPYLDGTEEYHQWASGWGSAKDEDDTYYNLVENFD